MTLEQTNEVITLYESGMSANQISIKLKINIATIMYCLRKNNIEIRSVSDGVNAYLKKMGKDSIVLAEELKEIIYGNLLGDGSIRKIKARAFYTHTDKHFDYILWLQKLFEESGVKSSTSRSSNGCYRIQTFAYGVFNEYKDVFYKENKRIVPEQTVLTPIILRQWFISDGSVRKDCGGISIAKANLYENLMKQLKNLFGDKCTFHYDEKRGCGKYYVPSKYLPEFYKYIGKCPTPCYQYKWERDR